MGDGKTDAEALPVWKHRSLLRYVGDNKNLIDTAGKTTAELRAMSRPKTDLRQRYVSRKNWQARRRLREIDRRRLQNGAARKAGRAKGKIKPREDLNRRAEDVLLAWRNLPPKNSQRRVLLADEYLRQTHGIELQSTEIVRKRLAAVDRKRRLGRS